MKTVAFFFVLTVLCVGAVGFSAEPALRSDTESASTRPPNVVLFLIDDLGYTDLACYGSDFYETPHVDRLAHEGMRFTGAYAACCVCSPTRVSVLTGKNPARLHITHAIPIQGYLRLKGPLPLIPAIYRKDLPLEEVTIAEALKPAAFETDGRFEPPAAFLAFSQLHRRHAHRPRPAAERDPRRPRFCCFGGPSSASQCCCKKHHQQRGALGSERP